MNSALAGEMTVPAFLLHGICSPAEATFLFVSGRVVYAIISIVGIACFLYIIARRLQPLLRAQPDPRLDSPIRRCGLLLKYWLGQWKQPRYRTAGTLHILLFAGFLLLVVRALSLILLGVFPGFGIPESSQGIAGWYHYTAAYAATLVFLVVTVAGVRRLVFKPARYGMRPNPDALFLLGLIGLLMLADAFFEASLAAAGAQTAVAPASLTWILTLSLAATSTPILSGVHQGAFFVHEITFFFLLCYRPFGIQFHVETSLFSIYFAKLDRTRLKPVRWGIPDDHLDELKSLGVKRFEDFTWKHMLDFYSCADCGRCSDQCPSHASGRSLSPRALTIKARDYAFQHYPVLGSCNNGQPVIGTLFSEDEVWSCTTCGACEAECPLLVEYIDKIVDLRRGLVDDGRVPQSLQKPLKALEMRGNPFGKSDKKRADWAKTADCQIPVVNGDQSFDVLYFVDSITSYDDRAQAIGRATSILLQRTSENFGILGTAEKDSGHDVRRFGEETLFMALRDQNTAVIRKSGVRRIVTADPHAFNALSNDYTGLPSVEHISQLLARQVKNGNLRFNPITTGDQVYTYHDPCYLGRHNGIYDAPRDVLDAIPSLKRVEMKGCKDRSLCCGGGGLALFYEAKEEERIGVRRVRMAAEAGANVIVTACPFCMVNIEDAIKVAGMEGKISAIDLTELCERQLA